MPRVSAKRIEGLAAPSVAGFIPHIANYCKMFFVYILQCADNSFYIGSSSDVDARIKEHNKGTKAAAHTFLRRPVTLVYTEPFETHLEAMRRERQLKGWSHAKKEALITGDKAALKALSKRTR